MSKSKEKGTTFETLVVEYLRERLGSREIERRTLNGRKDRGDVSGLFAFGQRVVVEVKNHQRMDLSGWVIEAELEAGNDDTPIWAVVHKRPRKGAKQMGEQYVTITLDQWTRLISGGAL